MRLLEINSALRKRTRYRYHCRESVIYLVYKRHKEEFYDARANKWTTVDGREEDSSDDENIVNVLAASHEGNLKNRAVYFWCMTRYKRPLPIA